MNDPKQCLGHSSLVSFAIIVPSNTTARIHNLDELASGFIEYVLRERFQFSKIVAQILCSLPWKLPHVDPKYEEFRSVVKTLLRKLERSVHKRGIVLNLGCTNAETLLASLQRSLTHGDTLPPGAGTKTYGEMFETARSGLWAFRQWATTQIRDRLINRQEYMMTLEGTRVTVPGLPADSKTSPMVNTYVDNVVIGK